MSAYKLTPLQDGNLLICNKNRHDQETDVRGNLKVVPETEDIKKGRLNWFRNVSSRDSQRLCWKGTT